MALPSAGDVEYIGGNGAGGMWFGLATTDKIGFFAKAPVVQQSVTAPNPTATTGTNEAAIVSINAALVALGLIVTT